MSTSTLSRRGWDEIEVGTQTPGIELPITYAKIAGHVYATRDWFPGHHDPVYAKAQGRENVYANTMFFQGFLSRVVLNYVGPDWFEHKRSLKIVRSVYPGDVLVGSATVTGKGKDDRFLTLSFDVQGVTRGEVAITGTVTVAQPLSASDPACHV